MLLIDLLKVLSGDAKIVIWQTPHKRFPPTGEVADLMQSGEITEDMLNMRVTNVYYSIGYSSIAIEVE